jgi:hypothetical protein
MKAFIALITAWTGAPAHAAEAPPAAPTYAGAPAAGRSAAMAREARPGTVAEAAAASITNLASLDRPQAETPRQRLGISLAAAAPAGGSKPSGPARPAAIYGHNVDDVVIGNARKKPPNGGRPAPAPRAAIYNGTITSEPTQVLHKADSPARASARRRAAPTPAQATTPPKR